MTSNTPFLSPLPNSFKRSISIKRRVQANNYLFLWRHSFPLSSCIAQCQAWLELYIQGSAEKWSPGLVNVVPAVAYRLCLNVTEAGALNPRLFYFVSIVLNIWNTFQNDLCTGLFNPSGNFDHTSKSMIGLPITKPFKPQIAKTGRFCFLYKTPWEVINYPSETWREVWTHFEQKSKFKSFPGILTSKKFSALSSCTMY